MKREISIILIALLGLTIFPSSAHASIQPNSSCSSPGWTQIVDGFTLTCTKAARSLTNPLGKKLIWKKGARADFSQAKTSSDRISILNSLGFGVWKKIDSYPGFNGEGFYGSLPCIVYVANTYEAQVYIWNSKVNYEMYGGSWLATDNGFLVVNEPDYQRQKCVKYFALKYGGNIVTQ